MLPPQFRLNSAEFSKAVKKGRRTGTRTVVVHLWDSKDQSEVARFGGPHFGLIVSKAVGNSVIRHRTYRRLRVACQQVAGNLPTTSNVVIRALPRSAQASTEELIADVSYALRKLQRS